MVGVRSSCTILAAVGLTMVMAADWKTAAQQLPSLTGSTTTFRTEINYVEVSARVVDSQGNFVRDLQKTDFQILENQKPQTIAAFDRVELPISRPRSSINDSMVAAAIEPDVATNVRAAEGGIYLLVLDALHTDPFRSQRVRMAARKFIQENLGANDLAAVAVIAHGAPAAQELTGNRRLLLAVADKFVGEKPRSTAAQQVEANNRQVVAGVTEPGNDLAAPDEKERQSNAQRTFSVLARLSDWLSGVRGRRKALVYISEGLDYDISATFSNLDRSPNSLKANLSGALLEETRDVIAAATQNNVTIYAVDPRGLTAMGGDSIELAMLADKAPVDTSLGTTDPSDPSAQATSTQFRPDYGLFSLQDELRIAQDSLRTLSDETGGFAALNSNDLQTAFARIVDENSSYYLLGYYSTNDKRDGKFRTIDVRIKGRPGLTVIARKGYLAPRGSTSSVKPAAGTVSDQLGALIASPVPVTTGISFRVMPAPFRTDDRKNAVLVTLEINGRDLKLTREGDRYTGKLDTLLVAYDRDGKAQASQRSAVDLGFKPDSYDRITRQDGSFRFVTQLELPAGTYRLDAAVVDSESKKGGALHYDLQVPDFSKGPVSISGLLLASSRASFWPTVADKGLKVRLSIPPTALREFTRDDVLALFAQIYDNAGTPSHGVDITTTIRNEEGLVSFSSREDRLSNGLQNTGSGYEYAVRVPLKDLAPGRYVLAVEARSRTGNDPSASRVVQFQID